MRTTNGTNSSATPRSASSSPNGCGAHFPRPSEHSLTLMRASLVKTNFSRARCARNRSGRVPASGRRRTQERRPSSRVDSGRHARSDFRRRASGWRHTKPTREVVRRLFADDVASVDAQMRATARRACRRGCRRDGCHRLNTASMSRSGDEHLPEFCVECRDRVASASPLRGSGGSRRDAEQVAARAALDLLEATDG